MSCKIVRTDEAERVVEFPWLETASSSPIQPHARATADRPSEDPSGTLAARLAEIEQRAQIERQAAYQQGVVEGTRAGEEAAKRSVGPVLAAFTKSIADLANFKPGLRRKAERDLVQLALAIARRIVHREISIDPEALAGIVRVALDRVADAEHCRVRVNPQHASYIQQSLHEFTTRNIEVIPDPKLDPGGVLFEAGASSVDASIGSQLEEIERGLIDRLAS